MPHLGGLLLGNVKLHATKLSVQNPHLTNEPPLEFPYDCSYGSISQETRVVGGSVKWFGSICGSVQHWTKGNGLKKKPVQVVRLFSKPNQTENRTI